MQRNRGEWERLEVFSRKLEIPREHFMERWAIKDRNGMDLTEAKDIKEVARIYRGTIQKRSL